LACSYRMSKPSATWLELPWTCALWEHIWKYLGWDNMIYMFIFIINIAVLKLGPFLVYAMTLQFCPLLEAPLKLT
jgi:hypothetical protein